MGSSPRSRLSCCCPCGLFFLLTVVAFLSSTAFAQAGAAPALAVETSSLPRAFLRQAYEVSLKAQNGTTPYKWEITTGSLPKGLNLNENGTLSGTPEEVGQFSFVVTVTDSARPAQQRTQEYILKVLAPLLAKWEEYPKVSGQGIEGSLKVSNQTNDNFDLTVIVLAVADNGRANALGYQHFSLAKNTSDKIIPFAGNLPVGGYQVNADVVAEIAATNTIHRARLVTGAPLHVISP